MKILKPGTVVVARGAICVVYGVVKYTTVGTILYHLAFEQDIKPIIVNEKNILVLKKSKKEKDYTQCIKALRKYNKKRD